MEYVGIHKKGEFSLSDLLKSVKERLDFHKAGAIATFIGVVRGETLGSARAVQLRLSSSGAKWGVNAVLFRYSFRQVRV